MEIACVIGSRLASPVRPGRSGGSRPGRDSLPDPVEMAERTEAMVRALESIGAAVESERSGEAFFAVDGLRGIYGGDTEGVLSAVREVVGTRARVGIAPTRFAAYAVARHSDDGHVVAAGLHAFLAPLKVSILRDRLAVPAPESEELVVALERLGVRTLGSLARLGPDQLADRFGKLGLRALQMARGDDEPLRPRAPYEELVERIELPEGTAGRQLDRALELLVDRLLAAPQRRGRTLLGLRLGAKLAGGGSWSVEQGLGRPSAAPGVLRGVLAPRLESLPGPAETLQLRALGFGSPAADQLQFALGGVTHRRRLRAAVREVRATQGSEALLKVLPVDADSRVPERRALLTPFPEP
jgi:protein ImuB